MWGASTCGRQMTSVKSCRCLTISPLCFTPGTSKSWVCHGLGKIQEAILNNWYKAGQDRRYIEDGGQEEEIICFQHTSYIGIGYDLVMLSSQDGLDIVSSCLSEDKRGKNCARLGTIASRTIARSTVAETVACVSSQDGLDIVSSGLSGDKRGKNCARLGTIASRTIARSTVAETVACVPSQDGLDIVSSCLSGDKRGMKRAMLEVVATKAVTSAQDVQRYIKCTLLAATTDFQVGILTSHLCIAPARADTALHTDTQSAAALGKFGITRSTVRSPMCQLTPTC